MGPWALEYCITVCKAWCCSAENYFSFYCINCHYSTELSLQLSPLTVLSAYRLCVLWNSSLYIRNWNFISEKKILVYDTPLSWQHWHKFVNSAFQVIGTNRWPVSILDSQLVHVIVAVSTIKAGSQYDAGASVALKASGWRWSWLEFNSTVTSSAFNQSDCPKIWHQELNLTSKKISSSVTFATFMMLMMLAPPASYC